MSKTLKNKKILVTAGPTWVPIDVVRVISNVSTGLTGVTIARMAAKMGGDVTLLLGPVRQLASSPVSGFGHRRPNHGLVACQFARLKIIRFKYFDELQKLVKSELRRKKYDILVHVAAVSDYRPAKEHSKKIKSGNKKLVLELRPTVKIVDLMRRQGKGAFLVMFKLEAGKSARKLVATAYNSLRRAGADMIVANNIDEITEKGHKAYIIDKDKNIIIVRTKEELAKRLLSRISAR